VSGINGDLRSFYMLSTELISIPTGLTFLCGMMTLWRGNIRFTVPMLFCLAWFFNFLLGGLSGVFLSDVPSDVTTHGSFFSMAHFHYTIMGGLVFTFFAAIYYWVPKMTGWELNERLGKIHFWTMFSSSTRRSRRSSPSASWASRAERRSIRTASSSSTTGSRSRPSASAPRCSSSSSTSSGRSRS
jgi:Heme/copper-type cytochrome/quinol oxidases, subunit 1